MLNRNELKYRKILQEQKSRGIISNYFYKKEILYLRQLKKEKIEKL